INTPKAFDGDKDHFDSFMASVYEHFMNDPNGFRDPCRKILFTLSYMTEGPA
ncbi:hypothetical protein BJ165DRAFT_1323310, partial [Panaeolus papilionaceus]